MRQYKADIQELSEAELREILVLLLQRLGVEVFVEEWPDSGKSFFLTTVPAHKK